MSEPLLIQLPSGDWIDPRQITGVRVMEDEGQGRSVVLIDRGDKISLGTSFATLAEAENMRDQFARRVNESRVAGLQPPAATD